MSAPAHSNGGAPLRSAPALVAAGGGSAPAVGRYAAADPVAARLLRLATYASVATACVLILAKLVAWLATGSVSVLAALVDSVMDAGASLVNLLAVHWSLMPPDAEHRFGHGKAEALAALGQSALIAVSALFLASQAVGRFLDPQPLEALGVGLGVIGFAIVATLALLALQRHVIRRTGSMAIRADALHYATDLATNLATVAALVLTSTGWSGWDPLFGLAIGAYILASALRIGYDAVQVLMDRELPEDERRQIADLARSVPQVRGVHGLRTRRSGRAVIVELHLELDDRLTLLEAHRIGERAERAIRARLPHADILIHHDPASLGEERAAVASPSA